MGLSSGTKGRLPSSKKPCTSSSQHSSKGASASATPPLSMPAARGLLQHGWWVEQKQATQPLLMWVVGMAVGQATVAQLQQAARVQAQQAWRELQPTLPLEVSQRQARCSSSQHLLLWLPPPSRAMQASLMARRCRLQDAAAACLRAVAHASGPGSLKSASCHHLAMRIWTDPLPSPSGDLCAQAQARTGCNSRGVSGLRRGGGRSGVGVRRRTMRGGCRRRGSWSVPELKGTNGREAGLNSSGWSSPRLRRSGGMGSGRRASSRSGGVWSMGAPKGCGGRAGSSSEGTTLVHGKGP